MQGTCVACNHNLQKPQPRGKFKAICSSCDKRRHGSPFRGNDTSHLYQFAKTLECAMCDRSFEHLCQMDVDHIDGNHDNNDPANLQSLCACCHRLKTWENRDTARPKNRKEPPEGGSITSESLARR